MDDSIKGVSYIGNPISHTAMYVVSKLGGMLSALERVEGCLVFAQEGMEVPKELLTRHSFVFTQTPQLDYVRFAENLADKEDERERSLSYTLTPEGYYLGEGACIGENSFVEPGALIGHGVKIGSRARIKAGAVIKKAQVGDDFTVGENCTVGTFGFTMTKDENSNNIRIPTLGGVRIGDCVEVGALTNISRGSCGDTVLEDYVKLDSFVHIGHDARLCESVEIPAGAIIGGFSLLEKDAFIGINATIRNRVHIGANAIIGMGAVVTRDVAEGLTVIGNPAREKPKKEPTEL